MTKDRYTPGEVRKMLHISPMALRYYMKKGLILGEKDEENGYHSFDGNDVWDLMEISYLRQVLDFSTDEIHDYLTSSSPDGYISILEQRRDVLIKEIAEKQKQLKIIENWEHGLYEVMKYENSIQVIECDYPLYVLIPKNQQEEGFYEIYQNPLITENLSYSCSIFDLKGENPVYTGFGYYVEQMEQVREVMSFYDCRMEACPAGKYLYGLFYSGKTENDPALLAPFMTYIREQRIKIKGQAYSSVYYVDRNRLERQFYYDVFIPLAED